MIECTFDKLKQMIKIDISTGDEITPRAIEYKSPLIIEDRSIDLWAYNLETLLAEKFETFMVRAEANTRMRDFYDICILLRYERRKVDKEVFKEAFYATSKRRGSEQHILNIDEIFGSVCNSPTMQEQWENYRKHNYYIGSMEWKEVMKSVERLREWII